MVALEMMAGIILVHVAITILVLHILHRSTRKAWLIVFMVWDVIFMGVCIAMISIYSFAGVPANCGGMTRSNWNPGDAPNDPAPGFTTIRFGPGLFGNYGELDIYCDLPQTDYAFCVILVFTYTLTLILSTTRIITFRYTPNIQISTLILEAEEKAKKAYSTNTSLHRTPSNNTSTNSNPTSPISITPVFPNRERGLEIDIDIESQTPAIISNGSRGSSPGHGGPPPYMPSPSPSPTSPTQHHGLDSVVVEGESDGNRDGDRGEEERSRSTIREYGKDQEFPGLER